MVAIVKVSHLLSHPGLWVWGLCGSFFVTSMNKQESIPLGRPLLSPLSASGDSRASQRRLSLMYTLQSTCVSEGPGLLLST